MTSVREVVARRASRAAMRCAANGLAARRRVLLVCGIIVAVAFIRVAVPPSVFRTVEAPAVASGQLVDNCPYYDTPSGLPRTDPACPRFICVQVHPFAGLGHRFSNVEQGILMSLYTGLPLAAPRLEHDGAHGSYVGANDLFQIPRDEQLSRPLCPNDASEVPPGWSWEPFTLSQPAGQGFPGTLKELPDMRRCNTIYRPWEFWPNDYSCTLRPLRRMFQPTSATGRALIAGLLYDNSDFNIAVHLRTGDIMPTSPEFSAGVVARMLTAIQPAGLGPKVHVWLFSEAPQVMLPLLEPLTAKAGAQLHSAPNITALSTLMHFVEADAFLASDSSMAWLGAWIAEKPVVLMPPNKRERPEFRNCLGSNICVREDGSFADGGALLQAARKKRSAGSSAT